MDYNKLRLLLDKYFEGNTSEEEETHLKKLLESHDIPSEFNDEKTLFATFSQMKEESGADESLNSEISEMIARHDLKQNRPLSILRWVSVAAAALLILAVINFMYNGKPGNTRDTFTDREQAYDAAKQVLSFIAQTINSEGSKLSEMQLINESMSAVNELSVIDKTINNIKTQAK